MRHAANNRGHLRTSSGSYGTFANWGRWKPTCRAAEQRHSHPADVRIAIVCTPTNSSWLNRIEAQFTAVRYFTLDGTGHPTHNAQDSLLRRRLSWVVRAGSEAHSSLPSGT